MSSVCRRKRSGSTPAGLARRCGSMGGMTRTRTLRSTVTLGIMVMTAMPPPRPNLWAGKLPTPGVSTIWLGTCSSGARTGTMPPTTPPLPRPIRRVQQVVYPGSSGAGVGTTAVTTAAPSAATATFRISVAAAWKAHRPLPWESDCRAPGQRLGQIMNAWIRAFPSSGSTQIQKIGPFGATLGR